MTRRQFLGRVSALTAGAALVGVRPSLGAPPPDRHNILLISIDSLRADHLGCYGYRRETSPVIDEIARESVIFENVIVQGAWTLPSMASMLTGQYVEHHGVVTRKKRFTDEHLTAAKVFASAGFSTAAIVENPYLTKAFGFQVGFDHFAECKARRVTSPALEWLEQRASGGAEQKPFFMWLHYLDPHKPYWAPRRYRNQFPGRTGEPVMSERPELSKHVNAYGKVPKGALPHSVQGSAGQSRHDVGFYIGQYDGEILYIDDELARLFRGIEKLGLLDHTIVVLTADHGECLGEHKVYFDHGVPWEPVVKIPLVFRVPGNKHGGRNVEGQVREIDILPTLLDLVGLKELTAALGEGHFDGESFAGCFDGGRVEDRPAFGTQGIMDFSYVRIPPWKYIEMKPLSNWKAIEEFNREFFRERTKVRELFNVDEDPFETRNLIEDMPRKAHEMRSALFRHKAEMAKKKSVAGKSVIDEETMKRLRGLGYAE